MSNITITINNIVQNITEKNYFYNEIKEYHEMLTGKTINIGIVTIEGEIERFKIISNKVLISQIPKFSKHILQ